MHVLDQSTQSTMSSRAHVPHIPLSNVLTKIANKNEYSANYQQGLPARITDTLMQTYKRYKRLSCVVDMSACMLVV